MIRSHRRSLAASAALAVTALAVGTLAARRPAQAAGATTVAPVSSSPVFGDDFWKRWGDGKGEVSGYDLTFPRYGELRKGVAVVVFVTETFSNSARVKSDPGKHPKSDEFPVMKLNLVQDFSTGIYDYNLMTSAFVALAPVNGRPPGSATKVSFSSQEWCGDTYGQLLFDAGSARLSTHSYFDGEADQSRGLSVPADTLAGDALLLWARGFAAPILAAGERREVSLVKSIRTARLNHRPIELEKAILSREAVPSRITVPAGTFEVNRRSVEIAGGPTWKISVETVEPHRLVEWVTSDGEKASLIAGERLEYWRLHGERDRGALARIGLQPRPPRTP
jgi:hypothetical protein